jgi:hypothetical protein
MDLLKLAVLIVPLIIGSGIRTIMKSSDYAAKTTERTNLWPGLIGVYTVLGIVQLAVALFLGYLWIVGPLLHLT